MYYNHNLNQNELKACHRTWAKIAFLLGAIAFNLHVAFSVDTEQNLSADFNHKFLCGFVVVMEAEKLEVCIHKQIYMFIYKFKNKRIRSQLPSLKVA